MPRSYTPTREQRAELKSLANNLVIFREGRPRPSLFLRPRYSPFICPCSGLACLHGILYHPDTQGRYTGILDRFTARPDRRRRSTSARDPSARLRQLHQRPRSFGELHQLHQLRQRPRSFGGLHQLHQLHQLRQRPRSFGGPHQLQQLQQRRQRPRSFGGPHQLQQLQQRPERRQGLPGRQRLPDNGAQPQPRRRD